MCSGPPTGMEGSIYLCTTSPRNSIDIHEGCRAAPRPFERGLAFDFLPLLPSPQPLLKGRRYTIGGEAWVGWVYPIPSFGAHPVLGLATTMLPVVRESVWPWARKINAHIPTANGGRAAPGTRFA